MDIHDKTIRCWYIKFDLVRLDIIRGALAKEDMMAFLHVKRVDCLLRPSLKIEKNPYLKIIKSGVICKCLKLPSKRDFTGASLEDMLSNF